MKGAGGCLRFLVSGRGGSERHLPHHLHGSKPDEVERFQILLGGVLDAMRKETTFVNATLHRDPEDATHFLLHETWTDHRDVVDVQIHRPCRQDWHDALPEILSKPREISVWRPLRSDRAG